MPTLRELRRRHPQSNSWLDFNENTYFCPWHSEELLVTTHLNIGHREGLLRRNGYIGGDIRNFTSWTTGRSDRSDVNDGLRCAYCGRMRSADEVWHTSHERAEHMMATLDELTATTVGEIYPEIIHSMFLGPRVPISGEARATFIPWTSDIDPTVEG